MFIIFGCWNMFWEDSLISCSTLDCSIPFVLCDVIFKSWARKIPITFYQWQWQILRNAVSHFLLIAFLSHSIGNQWNWLSSFNFIFILYYKLFISCSVSVSYNATWCVTRFCMDKRFCDTVTDWRLHSTDVSEDGQEAQDTFLTNTRYCRATDDSWEFIIVI